MTPKVSGFISMARVADVQHSVDFCQLLAMEVRGHLRNPHGDLQWAHMSSAQADVMFARASSSVVASQQALLFYLYSPDLIALRTHLQAIGISVSPIAYPDYMPKRRDLPTGS